MHVQQWGQRCADRKKARGIQLIMPAPKLQGVSGASSDLYASSLCCQRPFVCAAVLLCTGDGFGHFALAVPDVYKMTEGIKNAGACK